MTVGAALYSELSGDERTIGGRLGASWKLNGDAAQKGGAAPAPQKPSSWTGLYVGANAGFATADVSMTNRGPDEFFAPVGGSDSLSPSGWVGGGQIGYNLQMGTVVVGLEGMWSAPSLNDDHVGKFFEHDHWIVDVSQLYSLTGRLGLAVPGGWLPYVKGGFAGARLTTSMTTPADIPFVSQSKSWHRGWTVGGGLEYMLGPSWTVGLEYDYYSFDSKDATAIRTNDLGVDHWTASLDSLQTLTARLSVKLN
jgi:outer membrane immunogenic protein